MTSHDELAGWIDRTAVDPDGDQVGTIVDVYVDDETEQPEWLAVRTGLMGGRVNFVPVPGATPRGDDVVLAFTKAEVTDAPSAEADGALTQEEEATLYRHYGLEYSRRGSGSGLPQAPEPVLAEPLPAAPPDPQGVEPLDPGAPEPTAVRLRRWDRPPLT